MKFGFLGSVLIVLALGLTSCGTSGITNSGSGILYVSAQGNAAAAGVSAYGIDLTTGVLNNSNYGIGTGHMPGAIAELPSGNALFVANIQDNSISSYTVNSDGTLKAASSTTPTGSTPMGMTIDPSGKFLFVADQGSNQISVYSISNTALTPVAGSPFSDLDPRFPNVITGPVSVAVTPNLNFLYVANQFSNTVSVFSIASSGALSQLTGLAPAGPPPYLVGTAPSAVALTPDGNVLYVANAGTNNVSAFTACTNTSLNCTTVTGFLAPVAGSPFSAGLGPVAIAVAQSSVGEFLYVVDEASSQVSQYRVAIGTGVLTPASPAALSTGAGPVAIAVRTGSQTVLADGGITNYVYVVNSAGGNISAFSYDTTQGVLSVVAGSTVTTQGQPAGVVAK